MYRALFTIVLAGLLLVSPRPGRAESGPAPLVRALQETLAIEEQIEAGDWLLAEKQSAAIGRHLESYAAAAPQSAATGLAEARQRLAKLRQELARRQTATSYRAYFGLRKDLLELLTSTGYPTPPTLLVVRHDLKIARLAVSRENWQEVSHELNELEFNYRSALPKLVELGLSQQQTADALVKIARARDALTEGRTPQLLSLLDELESLLADQIGRGGED
ncbi:hypothetical protein JCM30471_17940 [Desulfuromonas carbonis]